MKEKVVTKLFITSLSVTLCTQSFITTHNETGAFPVVTSSETISIYVDENDDWLVHKGASLLQNDIEMVTGKKPTLNSSFSATRNIIYNSLHHQSQKKIFNSKKQLII
jgi:hypothetical protein